MMDLLSLSLTARPSERSQLTVLQAIGVGVTDTRLPCCFERMAINDSGTGSRLAILDLRSHLRTEGVDQAFMPPSSVEISEECRFLQFQVSWFADRGP